MQYLIDLLYTQTNFYKDLVSHIKSNPGHHVNNMYQTLFPSDIYSDYELFPVFCKAMEIILVRVIAHQVSLEVYGQVCLHIVNSVQYVILPNTIAQASLCIDEAARILGTANNVTTLYYKTILTTICNQATVLQLTTILSAVFLHNITPEPLLLLTWVESISMEEMHTAFTQIINDCIPTKFAEPAMKDLCLDLLNHITSNIQFFSFDSVYNLYLQTLYEISLSVSDTASDSGTYIANTVDTITPSLGNIVDLPNVENTELVNASDADLDSNNKLNVYPLFFNLITKGAFLFTGALLGVCIGPGFFPMLVLALYS